MFFATRVLALSVFFFFSAFGRAYPTLERHTADIRARGTPECPTYNYNQQGLDWPQNPAWELCGTGQQQSPINLPAGNFSSTHTPAFVSGARSVPGEIFNRCFGPEWVPTGGGAPTLSFDGETYDLLNWHTHTPSSEHAFGGIKQEAEIHFVFGTDSTPKAVAGIGIQTGQGVPFFSSVFDGELPPVGSPARNELNLDFRTILSSAQFRNYWTYRGSLTTPACDQGLRWFVAGATTNLSGAQFDMLNAASIDSVRALQAVTSEHEVNV